MLRILRSNHPYARAILLCIGGVFLVSGLGILSIALTPTPDLASFGNRQVALSTKIYDRTGETVLYDLSPDTTREYVPLENISGHLVRATIAIEDSRFYEHGGVAPLSFLRAALVNLTTGSYSQGGSTITQQVVKNSILTSKKSPVRKIWEWVLAIKLEQTYSKDEILEFYLNEIPYGGTLYGIEAASRAFFSKNAKDLSIAEAAYLAALPQAPTYFSPYGNNKEALDRRKNLVLSRMHELGFITKEEADAATAETITFSDTPRSPIIAPHFVFYVRQSLEEMFGPDVGIRGLKVITTLDAPLQQEAEKSINEYALRNAANSDAENAALVAIDPKTGEILSMVGSRNYFDTEIDGKYNVALGERQPGSTFKPFVYAAALLKGFTRDTIVFDLPTQFSTACAPSDISRSAAPCYAPSNYDDKFRGPMTFTTALAQSINIPAVKTLYLAGTSNVVSLAESFGIPIKDPGQYGLSLALGAGTVRLLDLTNAFAVFANDGTYHTPFSIARVETADGAVLYENKPSSRRVIDSGVTRDISAMLSDNQARQPSYAPINPLYFPGHDVAAKTGTTNDNRDFWTVGYTPNIVIGVWAGNNDNSPAKKELAGYVVAPMWNAVMAKAIAMRPKEFFGEPRGINDNLPPALKGIYNDGSGVHDILHFVSREDPTHPNESPGKDAQYSYWEYSVRRWSGQ